ncbi:glycolate oxidase subunit GlcF [Alphaproteobacteria bacterium]|nr:glycolate oxidase subunit GlcF [Alphaproteobacteria bacterium]
MQTFFKEGMVKDAETQRSEAIFRNCVHCGLCTGTCPTYQLLGDELDSPRGRIYLLKDMLENGRKPTKDVVDHLDRCLSCLACTTTCPSGVDYMHLIDHGRKVIERDYQRPLFERAYRWFLAQVLPRPALFRWLLRLAPLGGVLQPVMPKPLKAALALTPDHLPAPAATDRPHVHPAATDQRRGRVALFPGCAQQVLEPEINAATIRLLTRLGYEVEVVSAPCCGALTHHMGKTSQADATAMRMIDAVLAADDRDGLDALVITASGCGTTVKDYGAMFQDDPEAATRAGKVAALARDITEFVTVEDLAAGKDALSEVKITYHSACSMQHGQKITTKPKTLLKALGAVVREPAEGHLCCGSAGTYNLLQPEISGQLKDRKLRNIAKTQPQLVATGNIGCMKQLEKGVGVPLVHTAQLLDWATGGPKPHQLD